MKVQNKTHKNLERISLRILNLGEEAAEIHTPHPKTALDTVQ